MVCLKNLADIKIMCRICLTQSENMISMYKKLDEPEDSPLISDILENMLSLKINEDSSYPREICKLCYGNIRIILGIKELFTKSQRILEKYVSTLESKEYVAFELTSLENEFTKCLESKNDNVPSESEYVHDDYKPVKSRTTETAVNIDKSESQKHGLSENIKKIKIGSKKKEPNNIKRVEGNNFIIKKIDRTPKMLHKCVYCHKRFLTRDKLKLHFTTCKKYVVFKCDICTSKFSSLARKQQHIKLKHSASTLEIKCEICDVTFKNHNARSYHKLTRHNTEGKKYKCELCNKAFYIKNSLNQHMECHSRDVSKVVCPICGKGFHYRGGLFYHMKIHKNERNYICSFCNRRFLTMASLKRHTRIHTGERPYSCSLCTKTFCSVGEVKTHERRHTGQKPFSCKYCTKCFISPYNLKLHISSHAGIVPCDFCTKSFLNSEALKFHMDIKHNIRDKKPRIEQV